MKYVDIFNKVTVISMPPGMFQFVLYVNLIATAPLDISIVEGNDFRYNHIFYNRTFIT